MAVTVQSIMQQATDKTGLTDFGDDWFKGPLQAYIDDLKSPHLSEWGAAFLARLPVKDLIKRLQVVDCLKQNPEIEDVVIPPIVYITGHERSGTTMLHNFMSQHEKARFLCRWELMMPAPPPEAASFETDPRRAKVQGSIDALRGSDLEKMHWVEAHDPEECAWGLMDCTGLLGMAPGLIMPTWREWMDSNDMSPTFVNYRKIIKLLLWKNPVPDGGFLVLKSPQIANYIDAFSTVFPEACFVFIHRDPYRVLSSFFTLIDVVDGPFLQSQEYLLKGERDDKTSFERMCRYFNRLEAFATRKPQRVVNVQYMDLLADPAPEIASVFSHYGLPADDQISSKIDSYLAQQRAGGRVRPRQQFVDYGYSAGAVNKDPRIAHYLQHFNVSMEDRRNTGSWGTSD